MIEVYRSLLAVFAVVCIGTIIYTKGEANEHRAYEYNLDKLEECSSSKYHLNHEIETNEYYLKEWYRYWDALKKDTTEDLSTIQTHISEIESDNNTKKGELSSLEIQMETLSTDIAIYEQNEIEEDILFGHTWKALVAASFLFLWSFVPSVTFFRRIAYNTKNSLLRRPSNVYVRPMVDGTYQVIGERMFMHYKFETFDSHAEAIEFCEKLKNERFKKNWHKIF